MGFEHGRFAPSTTGAAHPGTLLAALLAWLDARSQGARFLLRLENLDPQRSSADAEAMMLEQLQWFGLDWDACDTQSHHHADHAAALDRLAAQGSLYPCHCSRARLKTLGRPAPDGGFAYDNHCRPQALPSDGWRGVTDAALRVRLPEEPIELIDDGGTDLSQTPCHALGDPIVRRRDGALAYALAVVVDDAAAKIDRIVRGMDLAPLTATQVALQRLLGLPTPSYRHHLLLLEPRGAKFAKFHGAVGADVLRQHYAPEELCGFLAGVCGLSPDTRPQAPADLLAGFDWQRVITTDQVVAWDGERLQHQR